MARFTGVPEAVIAQHEGRVPLGLFVKEARRPDKLLISRYDGSATAPDPYPESSRTRGDALFDGLRSVLANAMTDYLADTLGVHTDLPYRLSNSQVVRQWNWRSGIGRPRRLCRRGRFAARGAGRATAASRSRSRTA